MSCSARPYVAKRTRSWSTGVWAPSRAPRVAAGPWAPACSNTTATRPSIEPKSWCSSPEEEPHLLGHVADGARGDGLAQACRYPGCTLLWRRTFAGFANSLAVAANLGRLYLAAETSGGVRRPGLLVLAFSTAGRQLWIMTYDGLAGYDDSGPEVASRHRQEPRVRHFVRLHRRWSQGRGRSCRRRIGATIPPGTAYVPLTATNLDNRRPAVARTGRASLQVIAGIDDGPQVFTNVDCDSQG